MSDPQPSPAPESPPPSSAQPPATPPDDSPSPSPSDSPGSEGADIYSRVLATLQHNLGEAWAQRLSPEERELAEMCTKDLVEVLGESMTYGTDGGPEAMQVLAQLADFKSIEADRIGHYVQAAVWQTVFQGSAWLLKAAAPYLLAAV